jgi:hypothetical protein
LLAGFEDAGRIINGIHRLHVAPADSGAYVPLVVIATYPDLPMEECFPPPETTHEPGVIARKVGQGRVVYFPWDVDYTFWQVLNVDHMKLLRNAVLWATNEPAPLTVEGKGILDVSIWGQKNSITAHLVNLTNPMMLKGPLREVIPISSQKVTIRAPRNGRRVTKARLLVSGRDVAFREEGNAVVVDVPTIGIHEVVALDLA